MSAADLAETRGDYAAELSAIQSSLKPAQSFGSRDLRLASTYERMGAAYCDNGKLRDAESAYLRSLRIWETAAPDDPHLSVVLMGLTTVYTWTGETTKAERLARRAVTVRERSLGINDVRLATPLQNLAVVLQTEHRFVEARDVYDRALTILDRNGHANDILAALARGNLGKLLGRMGLRDDAIRELNAAIAIGDAAPGARPLPIIAFRTSVARLYGQAGKWQEAYATIQQAKDSAESIFGPDHFVLEGILLTYADILRHLRHASEAKRMEQRAKVIHQRFHRENNMDLMVEAPSICCEIP